VPIQTRGPQQDKVGKLVARLDSAMFSVDKESSLVRKLQKEKVIEETRMTEQLAVMRKNVMTAKATYKKIHSEKLSLDDRVKDLNSRLKAA